MNSDRTAATDPIVTDWVPSMKLAMDTVEVGERYYVQHVYYTGGKWWDIGGSVYQRETYGYSHVAQENEYVLDTIPRREV